MPETVWMTSRKKIVGVAALVGAAIATLATVTGQIAAVGESSEKVVSFIFGAKSGIVIQKVHVNPQVTVEVRIEDDGRVTDTAPGSTSTRNYRGALVNVEVEIMNKAERDATNCKATLIDIENDYNDAPLGSSIPGHGVESQFAVTFKIPKNKYPVLAVPAKLRIYCDAFISEPFPLTLPTDVPW